MTPASAAALALVRVVERCDRAPEWRAEVGPGVRAVHVLEGPAPGVAPRWVSLDRAADGTFAAQVAPAVPAAGCSVRPETWFVATGRGGRVLDCVAPRGGAPPEVPGGPALAGVACREPDRTLPPVLPAPVSAGGGPLDAGWVGCDADDALVAGAPAGPAVRGALVAVPTVRATPFAPLRTVIPLERVGADLVAARGAPACAPFASPGVTWAWFAFDARDAVVDCVVRGHDPEGLRSGALEPFVVGPPLPEAVRLALPECRAGELPWPPRRPPRRAEAAPSAPALPCADLERVGERGVVGLAAEEAGAWAVLDDGRVWRGTEAGWTEVAAGAPAGVRDVEARAGTVWVLGDDEVAWLAPDGAWTRRPFDWPRAYDEILHLADGRTVLHGSRDQVVCASNHASRLLWLGVPEERDELSGTGGRVSSLVALDGVVGIGRGAWRWSGDPRRVPEAWPDVDAVEAVGAGDVVVARVVDAPGGEAVWSGPPGALAPEPGAPLLERLASDGEAAWGSGPGGVYRRDAAGGWHLEDPRPADLLAVGGGRAWVLRVTALARIGGSGEGVAPAPAGEVAWVDAAGGVWSVADGEVLRDRGDARQRWPIAGASGFAGLGERVWFGAADGVWRWDGAALARISDGPARVAVAADGSGLRIAPDGRTWPLEGPGGPTPGPPGVRGLLAVPGGAFAVAGPSVWRLAEGRWSVVLTDDLGWPEPSVHATDLDAVVVISRRTAYRWSAGGVAELDAPGGAAIRGLGGAAPWALTDDGLLALVGDRLVAWHDLAWLTHATPLGGGRTLLRTTSGAWVAHLDRCALPE